MTIEIPLTRGKVALIDDEDFDKVKEHRWFTRSCSDILFYANCEAINDQNIRTTMSMHKLIMSTPPGCEVDHINHNGLDNRKANLRFVTRQQNAANARKHRDSTSKYRGVSLYRARQKWLSEIRVDDKLIFLGIFFDELEAAKTYDVAAKKYFGEYAFLNFPDESNKSCAEEKQP